MGWFHGSPHRVAPGEVLCPGAAPANYTATRGARVVFVTDRRVEAWHWGRFAAEMAGADEVFVYLVAPHTPPVPLEVPEQHPDGSDYAEFTCAAATVLEVLEAGPPEL